MDSSEEKLFDFELSRHNSNNLLLFLHSLFPNEKIEINELVGYLIIFKIKLLNKHVIITNQILNSKFHRKTDMTIIELLYSAYITDFKDAKQYNIDRFDLNDIDKNIELFVNIIEHYISLLNNRIIKYYEKYFIYKAID